MFCSIIWTAQRFLFACITTSEIFVLRLILAEKIKSVFLIKGKTSQIRLVNIFSVNMTNPKWRVIFSDITFISYIRCDLWHFPTSRNIRMFTDCSEQRIFWSLGFVLLVLPEDREYSRRFLARPCVHLSAVIVRNTLTLISNAPWIHLALSRRNIFRLLRNSPVIQIKVFYVIFCVF